LNYYIENPFSMMGEEFPQGQALDKEFFNLLGLLNEDNDILRECRIGRLRGGRLTK
jgi:hypothetical protein